MDSDTLARALWGLEPYETTTNTTRPTIKTTR